MAVAYSPFRDVRRVAFAPEFRPASRLAPIDLYRSEDTYVLSVDLPGVDAGSIDVDVDGRVLTVRAQRTAPAVEGATWISRERSSGAYVRKLNLGDSIDTEGIAADYANGVLTVTLPVSEKAKPRKVAVGGTAAVVESDAQ
ncbi:MAG TPA: Hsp20/alpha crystallin family protein [Rhodoglobus sp.]|nr:Hsp20/alpha crystallin family protein [Rhodoglobus sp.]